MPARRLPAPAGAVRRPAAGSVRRSARQAIRSAFADGWDLEALEATTYRGVVGEAHAPPLGLPAGTVVDEPAWLARVRAGQLSDCGCGPHRHPVDSSV